MLESDSVHPITSVWYIEYFLTFENFLKFCHNTYAFMILHLVDLWSFHKDLFCSQGYFSTYGDICNCCD